MSPLVIIQFLLLIFANWITTVQVGLIKDMFLSSPFANIIAVNGSCTECICSMLSTNNIIGLICAQNTICWFFHNYSLPYILTSTLNSSFYFLIVPPEEQSSTYKTTEKFQMTTMTTSMSYSKLTASAAWSPTGETVAGNGSVGSGAMLSLSGPGPIAFDADNNLYVNDYGHHRVILYPSNGSTPRVAVGTGTAGSTMNQLNSANGIAVTSNGTLYVADTDNHRIQRWLPGASNGTTVAGITGSSGSNLSQLNQPQSVAIDSADNMYIYDGKNNRVLLWPVGASQGIVVAGNGLKGTALNNIASAYDAQVDSSGHIYVPDFTNGRVLQWTPPSSFGILVAGQVNNSGSSASQLKQPTQVIVDSAGKIYVCDYGNHRVHRWINGSTMGSTIVGTGTAGRNSNQLNHPYGIAFDLSNNLYVADADNGRIQRFNLTHY